MSEGGGILMKEDKKPAGALLVTGVLLAVILVSWFGMYFLHLARA